MRHTFRLTVTTAVHAIVVAFLLLTGSHRADARTNEIQVEAHVATTVRHELDTTDVGFGGRFGLKLDSLLGIEGELSFYPADVPAAVPVSGSRLEGLFGITLGPRFDRFSVFGKVRPGFVRFGGAPGPVACILIYPPPLSCVLAEGETVLALDIGGGVELYLTKRSLVRIDLSNLWLRYPGPTINRDREVFTESGFWGGNFRLTVGAGLRF